MESAETAGQEGGLGEHASHCERNRDLPTRFAAARYFTGAARPDFTHVVRSRCWRNFPGTHARDIWLAPGPSGRGPAQPAELLAFSGPVHAVVWSVEALLGWWTRAGGGAAPDCAWHPVRLSFFDSFSVSLEGLSALFARATGDFGIMCCRPGSAQPRGGAPHVCPQTLVGCTSRGAGSRKNLANDHSPAEPTPGDRVQTCGLSGRRPSEAGRVRRSSSGRPIGAGAVTGPIDAHPARAGGYAKRRTRGPALDPGALGQCVQPPDSDSKFIRPGKPLDLHL